MPQLDRKFGIAQLRRGNVDRQGDVVPRERIAAGLAHDPQADRIDQPALFGDGDEHVGSQFLAVGARPAQQAFDRHDFARIAVDQRLVVYAKLVIGERMAQLVIHFLELFAAAVEAGVEPGATHLAALFGGIHRNVRAAEQFGGGHVVLHGPASEADTGPQCQPAVLDMDGLGQPVDDPAAQSFEQRSGDRSADHHRIFIAAEAIDCRLAIADL